MQLKYSTLRIVDGREIQEMGWSVIFMVEFLGIRKSQLVFHVWVVPHAYNIDISAHVKTECITADLSFQNQ